MELFRLFDTNIEYINNNKYFLNFTYDLYNLHYTVQ